MFQDQKGRNTRWEYSRQKRKMIKTGEIYIAVLNSNNSNSVKTRWN